MFLFAYTETICVQTTVSYVGMINVQKYARVQRQLVVKSV